MENYIYKYKAAIDSGSITAGRWIKALYDRIDKDLKEGVYRYDQAKAARAIVYIEHMCHHHEGALAPGLIKPELWQKAVLSLIFGLVDEDGNRHFREVMLIIGRKNGKTLLASAIASYMTFADGEYGARIFFAAPKLEQAKLCYNAYVQSIENEPELKALVKKRRSDIYVPTINATGMPIAYSAQKSDGLNPSLAVCDEIASWPGQTGLRFYQVIKSAMGARKQPLLLSISSAGYERAGIYDDLYTRGTAYLQGHSSETRLLPVIYQVDDPAMWQDIDELKKSMPNMGVSVQPEYLLDEMKTAEISDSKRAEFLTKYADTPENSSVAWLKSEDIEALSGQPMPLRIMRGYAVGGIDLSRTTDLTAATLVTEKDGDLYVYAHFWMPADRVEEATARDNLPYEAYIKRGILTLSDGAFVDYKLCEEWFDQMANEGIMPLVIGYDRYSAQYLVHDMQKKGYQMSDVYQGYNLTPVIREAEGMISGHKIHIGDNDLLKVHLYSTALKTESGSDRVKLAKVDYQSHIDGTAALIDALCVRQHDYGIIGAQLANKPRSPEEDAKTEEDILKDIEKEIAEITAGMEDPDINVEDLNNELN